jgi:uncharacterized Ntn-hydrolase superfamily protein
MTFSIVALDPSNGDLGVATQSRFLAVGAVVPWARAGVGAVATQSFADVSFGARGLDLISSGLDAPTALDRLLAEDDQRDERQVGVIDASGRAASWTGPGCFAHASSLLGEGFAAQGNILASDEVVSAIAEGFRASTGPLAERLVEALRAGQRAGGDRRGMESAALLVVRDGGGYGGRNDRYVDLRVDDHPDPIEELARILSLHRLYFERPREEDLLDADRELEGQIEDALVGLGKRGAEGSNLWDALFEYMGWENLEERWAGPGRIDPRVLAYLREHAARGA